MWPPADIDGEKVSDSLWRNGRLEVRVSKGKFEVDIVEEMFSDTSCAWGPELDGRKMYAISGLDDELSGRSMIVGVYGRDCEEIVAKRRDRAPRTPVVELLMMCAVCGGVAGLVPITSSFAEVRFVC